MLRNYLKIALRNLARNKVYSAINIGGMAIGMATCLLIALYVHDELSYDRFHLNFDSIYRITEVQKQEDGTHPVAVTPGPLAAALQKDFAEIEQIVRVGRQNGLLQHKKNILESDNILIADPSLFQIFDFHLLKGRASKVFLNAEEVILTEHSAALLFGEKWASENVVGRTITLQSFQKIEVKVVGIIANFPTHSSIQGEVLLPFKFLEKYDEWSMKWNGNSYHTYMRLHSKANASAFAQKIKGVLKKYNNDANTQLLLQPLSSIYLESKFDFQTDWGKRGDVFYVYLFVTIGLVVLLIAVFNFINLSTAKVTQRVKEVAVRKIIGASRFNLISQFQVEAMLIIFLAMGLAISAIEIPLSLFNQFLGKTLTLPLSNVFFWISILAFSIVITLISSLYPSFMLSASLPSAALKAGQHIPNNGILRKVLVVGQFSLSIVLMVCSITIYRQMSFIQQKNLGFEKDNLLYFRLKGDAKAQGIALKQEAEKLSSIEAVSPCTNNLVNVSNSSNIEWEGQPVNPNFLVTQINADPDFIPTIGAKMAAGRNFSYQIPRDSSNQLPSYLLNETAAHKMGWTAQTALGKKVKFWGLEGLVVGVVKDFHFKPLNTQIEPFIFRFRPKEFYFDLMLRVRPQHISKAIAQVSTLIKKYDKNNPVSYGFVNQDLHRLYFNDQQAGQIVFVFTLLAILISCLGLLGLATFSAEIRTKEIGIRKVLGASVLSIIALLSKDFLKLVVVAIVLASPLAYYFVQKWLQNFAYRIEVSIWIFVLVGVLAIIIAFLTVSYQSIKAALANPVKSLKTE